MCPATVLTAHGMHGQYDTMPLLSDVRVFTSREAYLKSTSICKRGRDRAKQRERASRSRARERERAQNRERMSKTERERAKHTHTHRERERERESECVSCERGQDVGRCTVASVHVGSHTTTRVARMQPMVWHGMPTSHLRQGRSRTCLSRVCIVCGDVKLPLYADEHEHSDVAREPELERRSCSIHGKANFQVFDFDRAKVHPIYMHVLWDRDIRRE